MGGRRLLGKQCSSFFLQLRKVARAQMPCVGCLPARVAEHGDADQTLRKGQPREGNEGRVHSVEARAYCPVESVQLFIQACGFDLDKNSEEFALLASLVSRTSFQAPLKAGAGHQPAPAFKHQLASSSLQAGCGTPARSQLSGLLEASWCLKAGAGHQPADISVKAGARNQPASSCQLEGCARSVHAHAMRRLARRALVSV